VWNLHTLGGASKEEEKKQLQKLWKQEEKKTTMKTTSKTMKTRREKTTMKTRREKNNNENNFKNYENKKRKKQLWKQLEKLWKPSVMRNQQSGGAEKRWQKSIIIRFIRWQTTSRSQVKSNKKEVNDWILAVLSQWTSINIMAPSMTHIVVSTHPIHHPPKHFSPKLYSDWSMVAFLNKFLKCSHRFLKHVTI